MTPPSMESIFLILSGVILAAGILYWLWSHIQLTQKKVQLLENAVFELRGMLTTRGPGPPSPSPVVVSAPTTSYADLPDDDWEAPEESVEAAPAAAPAPVNNEIEIIREDAPDLEPGGRILPAAVVPEVVEETSAEEFRELFLAESGAQKVAPETPQSLESMPVKELRRLAEQRGITGVADMRKKELLTALRQQVAPTVVEKTLDLTVEAVEEEATVEAIPLE